MKRPSIKLTLGLLFGLLTVAAVGQGGFALMQVSAIGAAANVLGDSALPGVDQARQMDTDTSDFRLAEIADVMASTDAAATKAEADLSVANKALQADMTAFKTKITDPDDLVKFNAFTTAWATYYALHEKLAAMSVTNTQDAAAAAFITNDMRPAFDKLGETLQALTDSKNADASNAAAVGRSAEATATLGTFAVLVAIVAIGAASIWFGFIGIASPISRITVRMRKLTEGDRDTPVPYMGRADEIGAMAAALENFREAAIETLRLNSEAEAARRSVEAVRASSEQERAQNEDVAARTMNCGVRSAASAAEDWRVAGAATPCNAAGAAAAAGARRKNRLAGMSRTRAPSAIDSMAVRQP